MNIISALMAIAMDSIDCHGKQTMPDYPAQYQLRSLKGSDGAMKTATNKAKIIACTKIPNAFSSDWGSRRALA
jgi:hypothetical protein